MGTRRVASKRLRTYRVFYFGSTVEWLRVSNEAFAV